MIESDLSRWWKQAEKRKRFIDDLNDLLNPCGIHVLSTTIGRDVEQNLFWAITIRWCNKVSTLHCVLDKDTSDIYSQEVCEFVYNKIMDYEMDIYYTS